MDWIFTDDIQPSGAFQSDPSQSQNESEGTGVSEPSRAMNTLEESLVSVHASSASDCDHATDFSEETTSSLGESTYDVLSAADDYDLDHHWDVSAHNHPEPDTGTDEHRAEAPNAPDDGTPVLVDPLPGTQNDPLDLSIYSSSSADGLQTPDSSHLDEQEVEHNGLASRLTLSSTATVVPGHASGGSSRVIVPGRFLDESSSSVSETSQSSVRPRNLESDICTLHDIDEDCLENDEPCRILLITFDDEMVQHVVKNKVEAAWQQCIQQDGTSVPADTVGLSWQKIVYDAVTPNTPTDPGQQNAIHRVLSPDWQPPYHLVILVDRSESQDISALDRFHASYMQELNVLLFTHQIPCLSLTVSPEDLSCLKNHGQSAAEYAAIAESDRCPTKKVAFKTHTYDEIDIMTFLAVERSMLSSLLAKLMPHLAQKLNSTSSSSQTPSKGLWKSFVQILKDPVRLKTIGTVLLAAGLILPKFVYRTPCARDMNPEHEVQAYVEYQCALVDTAAVRVAHVTNAAESEPFNALITTPTSIPLPGIQSDEELLQAIANGSENYKAAYIGDGHIFVMPPSAYHQLEVKKPIHIQMYRDGPKLQTSIRTFVGSDIIVISLPPEESHGCIDINLRIGREKWSRDTRICLGPRILQPVTINQAISRLTKVFSEATTDPESIINAWQQSIKTHLSSRLNNVQQIVTAGARTVQKQSTEIRGKAVNRSTLITAMALQETTMLAHRLLNLTIHAQLELVKASEALQERTVEAEKVIADLYQAYPKEILEKLPRSTTEMQVMSNEMAESAKSVTKRARGNALRLFDHIKKHSRAKKSGHQFSLSPGALLHDQTDPVVKTKHKQRCAQKKARRRGAHGSV